MLLGDVEDSEERRLTLVEETNKKMERFGDAGTTRPKQVLDFVRNLQYKTVGGQYLYFCIKHDIHIYDVGVQILCASHCGHVELIIRVPAGLYHPTGPI